MYNTSIFLHFVNEISKIESQCNVDEYNEHSHHGHCIPSDIYKNVSNIPFSICIRYFTDFFIHIYFFNK